MIIPFIFTLDTVNNGQQLQWVFNKAVSFCEKEHWPVIAQKQYFEHYGERCSEQEAQAFDYDMPQPIYLERIQPIVIPSYIEENFINRYPSQVNAYLASVKYEWDEMEQFLINKIHELQEKTSEKVEAIMSMRYYTFLNSVCDKCGIQLIYFEVGAFRGPNYRNTAYLDFKGLQGNASIAERYKKFQSESEYTKIPFLTSKEILSLFLNIDQLYYLWKEDTIPEYEIGIVAGYSTPSITTPYNAITLDEMIYKSRKLFDAKSIGIRLHPGDPLKTQPAYGNIDNSGLIDFILKSKRIISNGSNVSYEAALYNRPTYDLGWSQFAFATNTSINDLPDKIIDNDILNFVAFAVLIPFELLGNVEYLRYRLRKPKETELYMYHLKYYFEVYGGNITILDSEDRLKKLINLRLEGIESQPFSIETEFSKAYKYLNKDIRLMKVINELDVSRRKERLKDEYADSLKKDIDIKEKIIQDNKEKLEQTLLKSNEEKKFLIQKNKELEQKIKEKNEELEQKIKEITVIEKQLNVVLNSRSYKSTKFLRKTADRVKRILKI